MEELREQLQGKYVADGFDTCCRVYCPSSDDFDEERGRKQTPPIGFGTYFSDYDVKGDFFLSPIQEHSEPSSSDGGGGGVSDNRFRSLSCHEIVTSTGHGVLDEDDPSGRSQTYPRTHADETVAAYNRRKYEHHHRHHPLEPRELDPEMFFQLHTADSQEELQEFLLLESQCMSTDGGGLHAAFVDKTE